MDTPENQRTIGKEITFSGRSLQTGKPIEVACKPASPGSGIVFCRKDLGRDVCHRLGDLVFAEGHERRSAVGVKGREIQTVEHFMAALWGLCVDNIRVELTGEELPGMDGSAIEFVAAIKSAGVEEQSSPRRYIRIDRPIELERGDSSLAVYPDTGFSVSYFIDYDCASIPAEEFRVEFDKMSFERDIAPARTFCLKKEAEALLKAGLGRGATLENTLVMDEEGPIGTSLRFPNEPVRHKVLDLIGDLYLLGIPLVGRVAAKKSGHRLNLELVKRIHEEYIKEQKT